MTTVSTITEYTGDVPSREMDRKDFNDAVYAQLGYIKTFGGEFNTSIGQINTVAGEVNTNALNAAASALASASSANAAPYNPATTYDTGDRAIGSDGNTYGCLNDSVTGDNPVGSVTGNWVAITVLTSVIDFVLGGLLAPCAMVRGGAPSDGGGLNVNYTAFVADIEGLYYAGGASSVALTAASAGNELRFVYVNSSGVMTSASTAPTGNYVPVALAYVTASDIVSVKDVRKYSAVPLGPARVLRPQFVGLGTTALNIVGPGAYNVYGVGRVWFTSTLNYTLTSLAASTDSYVYIDKSSLLGQGPITVSNLIDSTTAPTYSESKGGWYNGDDLCIMGVYGLSGSTYARFSHDGGEFVSMYALTIDLAETAIDTTWTDQALTIPAFSTRAAVTFLHKYDSASAYGRWRRNGSSESPANLVTRVTSTGTDDINQLVVMTDSAQTIEYSASASGSSLAIHTNGWFFGQGM